MRPPFRVWFCILLLSFSALSMRAPVAMSQVAAVESSQAVPSAAAPSPPPRRYGHTATFDPLRDRMVVFGGSDAGLSNEVWALALPGGTAWSTLAAAGNPPSARHAHTAVYDPVRDRIVVFAGADAGSRNDVWALSLSGSPTWTELTPTGRMPIMRQAHTAIYDPVRDRMVVFGGMGSKPRTGDDLPGMGEEGSRNDVWALSLSGNPTWSALAPAGNPPSARYEHTAIYDPVRDRMLVFGGFDPSRGSRNDVWALSLSGSPAWSALATSGRRPAARRGHTAVYDPVHDRMVVFGGSDGYSSHKDAWALSLSGSPAWSELARNSPLAARNAHTAISDTVRDRMVVFGGIDASTRNDVWALALSGAPAWSALSAAERMSSGIVHDPTPFTIGLEGGVAVPGGRFSDPDRFNAKAGMHLGGSFDYRTSDRFAFGVDGSYNTNKRNDVELGSFIASLTDKYTTIQIGAHAKFFLSKANSPTSLWVLLGAGGYSLTEKWAVTYNNGVPPSSDEGNDKTGMRPGAKIGLGADFNASKHLTFGVGADFNYIVLNADKTDENFEFVDYKQDVSSIQYIGVHAGITYRNTSK